MSFESNIQITKRLKLVQKRDNQNVRFTLPTRFALSSMPRWFSIRPRETRSSAREISTLELKLSILKKIEFAINKTMVRYMKFYNPVSSEVLRLEHLETEVILTVFVSISFKAQKCSELNKDDLIMIWDCSCNDLACLKRLSIVVGDFKLVEQ